MNRTHYVLGPWPTAMAACGITLLANRQVTVTRDPSHVSCRRCRRAMLRMARRWDTLPNLAQ